MTQQVLNFIGERVSVDTVNLVKNLKRFPFVGMLLRTYITNPEAEDLDIFQKTLKNYHSSVNDLTAKEIEESFEIFQNIPLEGRKYYIMLYKILKSGI